MGFVVVVVLGLLFALDRWQHTRARAPINEVLKKNQVPPGSFLEAVADRCGSQLEHYEGLRRTLAGVQLGHVTALCVEAAEQERRARQQTAEVESLLKEIGVAEPDQVRWVLARALPEGRVEVETNGQATVDADFLRFLDDCIESLRGPKARSAQGR